MAKESRAIKLLRLVWDGCNKATGHSWERLNHSLHTALQLAIGSGFQFGLADFATIDTEFRFEYWGGRDNGGFAESFYSLACAVDNISACHAFEAWKNRKPIIADAIDYHQRNGNWKHGGGGSRKQGRLCVGCSLEWHGENATVTSMGDGKTEAVACSYKGNLCDSNRPILHRYKLTPEAIIADRAERKERVG